MAFLLDTDVAIHLRDGDPSVTGKVAALQDAVLMSIVTVVPAPTVTGLQEVGTMPESQIPGLDQLPVAVEVNRLHPLGPHRTLLFQS